MDSSAFSFQLLSPDLIVESLASLGIYIDSGLTALNSYENRVYQFHDEEHKRYVAKFYRPIVGVENKYLKNTSLLNNYTVLIFL